MWTRFSLICICLFLSPFPFPFPFEALAVCFPFVELEFLVGPEVLVGVASAPDVVFEAVKGGRGMFSGFVFWISAQILSRSCFSNDGKFKA